MNTTLSRRHEETLTVQTLDNGLFLTREVGLGIESIFLDKEHEDVLLTFLLERAGLSDLGEYFNEADEALSDALSETYTIQESVNELLSRFDQLANRTRNIREEWDK